MSHKLNLVAPGRLGNPDMILQDDPRLLPELVKALKALGYGGKAEVHPPTDFDEYHAQVGDLDKLANQMYDAMPIDLPGDEEDDAKVQYEEITIDGLEGNKVILNVFRPREVTGPLPAVLYIHGGGMMYLKTMAKPHRRWVTSLAAKGVVAIAVDFRNVWNSGEYCPFPAGLNDCAAAVQYVHSRKMKLGVSKIVIQGESGGGNLVLATALKAKGEGWEEKLDGVYCYCPHIAGEAHAMPEDQKRQELPSAIENDGYIQYSAGIPPAARYYSPGNTTNPVAWPYFATVDDLRGLPPHAMSFDEMDTLRDEGISYYRKLLAAGVKATGEMSFGIPHGGRLMYRQAVPEEHEKLLGLIAQFAKGL